MLLKLQIAGLAVLILVAALIWAVFLRAVPASTAVGRITAKEHKPADTYWHHQHGSSRGFQTATPIPVSECYVFEIESEAVPIPVHFALNTIASKDFTVGQNVRIRYQVRGLAPLWRKVYVLEMTVIP